MRIYEGELVATESAVVIGDLNTGSEDNQLRVYTFYKPHLSCQKLSLLSFDAFKSMFTIPLLDLF